MEPEKNQGYRGAILLTRDALLASVTQYFPSSPGTASSNGQDRVGSTGLWSQVNATVWADQTGTLTLEVSDDRSTWSTLGTALTVSASDINEYGWQTLTKRFWRWKYVNDATNQGTFRLYEDKITGPVRMTVTGSGVANDAPDSENPVKVGFKAESTTPAAVADADRSDLGGTLYGAAFVNLRTAAGGEIGLVNTNQQVVTLKNSSGTEPFTDTSVGGRSNGWSAAVGGLTHHSFPWYYNASSYDHVYGNHTATPFPSAARTATASSADQTLYNGTGVRLTINVTAITATPSVVFTVEVKDSVSGTYTTVLTSAAITGTGTTTLRIHPGMLAVANLVADDLLARTWRVTATHADADSITFSVSADVML